MRQPEQAAADQVDPIVDDLVLVVEESAADGEETHRRQGAGVGPQVELVGGNLLEQEPVEGEVGVERPDHVVAVGVGEGVSSLFREDVALGVGIAGHVEPVPSPPLAVERRGQQPVDHPCKGVRRPVGLERLDLLGRRRNAQEVERGPADQGPPVGRGDGVSPSFSSRASTNASTGVRTQPGSWTRGGGIRSTGVKAQ